MIPIMAALVLLAASADASRLRLPEFREIALANGLQVYLAEDHATPTVALRLILPAGGEHDPLDKKGLAIATASGCLNGTRDLDGTQIWLEWQRLGAEAGGWADHERTVFSLLSLSSTWEASLDLLGRCVQTPTFPEHDLRRLQRQAIAGLEEQWRDPAYLARAHLQDCLYAGALGEPVTKRSIRRISRDDLLAFHRAYYRPNSAILVVAGDFQLDRAEQVIRDAFAGWPAPPAPARPAAPLTPPVVEDGPKARLIHKPGLTQAQIMCGQTGPTQSDPDRFAFDIGTTALGGDFGSRLMSKLRSEGGKTYGVGAWREAGRRHGTLVVSTFTRNAEVGAVIDTMRSVIAAVEGSGLTDAEFEDARNLLAGRLPVSLETTSQAVGGVADALSWGRPLDEYALTPARYQEVDASQANRVLSARLRPEEMTWIIVGDRRQIEGAMRRFGAYEVVDARLPFRPGNLIQRTRVGFGLAWNSAARGARLSLLHRRLVLAGAYGFAKRGAPWGYDGAGQATIDLHKASSECAAASTYVGATATFAGDIQGVSPHVGLRLFPSALGDHFSVAVEMGGSSWSRASLPGFYAGIGFDRFF